MSNSRIVDRRLPKHPAAISYVNALVIDLKKQLLGYPVEPLTMERLDEWTQVHCRSLSECTEPDRYYSRGLMLND